MPTASNPMLRQLSSVPMLNPQPLPVLWLDGSDPAMIRALFERVAQLEQRILEIESPTLALNTVGAAKAIGVGRKKVWMLKSLDDKDPMKLRFTPYGTVPISEIKRHLEVATKPKTKARK